MKQKSCIGSSGSRLVVNGLAVSVMLALGTNAYALPTGGAVSAGGASIASGNGTMTINQSSQNVAINWQSFGIGQAEAVKFVQPNSSSVALNRVLGPDASSILGSLSANGKVFLVNPNGILFGQGAQVNVAGLVASTRNITDGDFMAGNYKFSGTGSGSVVNQGSINADGGYVALLGATVSNQGTIVAKLGTVALAAGNAFTLDVAGDGLLNVVVNQGAVDALVQNGGMIRADGGLVLLTAQSAGGLLQSAVNNTGVIQAQTAENHNGTIRLLAGMENGTVSVSGTLDVSGTGAGQTGGNVTMTGQHVGLFGAQINASGDAGGGTVLVGGGYQGNNPAVQNAAATYMSADSRINVDAITNGNGGTAVVWSNDSTRAYGGITARAGAQGGDGGLIETSGHWLDTWGVNINASAPNGKAGTWLLDPADVDIVGPPGANNGSFNGGNPNIFSPNTGVSTASVGVATLVAALQAGGGTNVTITTTNTGIPGGGNGDITVSAALTWSTPAIPATLTLNAARDVNINAAVTHGDGNLVVCCGRDVNVRAAISTAGGGGSVSLSGGRDVTLFGTGAISATNGNITLCAGHDVNVIGKITLVNSGTGALSGGLASGLVLSAGNAATGPGVAGGTVILPSPADPLRPSITRSAAPVTDVAITYNPTSYLTPTDYVPSLILVGAVVVTQKMLVFPGGADKVADGTTTANFTSLQGNPAGVTLNGGGTASFANAGPGLNIPITYSGFTLGGPNAANFALPTGCCGAVTTTTGNITGGLAAAGIVPSSGSLIGGLALAALPAFFSPGVALAVEGINMPTFAVAEVPPAVLEEVPPPPPAYVPPPFAPRRTRN